MREVMDIFWIVLCLYVVFFHVLSLCSFAEQSECVCARVFSATCRDTSFIFDYYHIDERASLRLSIESQQLPVELHPAELHSHVYKKS